ncbi:MAG: VWA domain-containing protein [Granulosicoccus sp.]
MSLPDFLLFDFATPWILALLPLALLPLLERQRDTISMPSLAWLPPDTLGPFLQKVLSLVAVVCLAALIIALAGPGSSRTDIEKIGRGAELSILMDRSASMDAEVRRHQMKPGEQPGPAIPKSQVVRQALSWLVDERPDNRYALTLFNVSPIPVAPFSDDEALILAGLEASGVGRGPNKTNMGLALVSAIQRFDERSYTGSRAILLVSDGGARLDEETRTLITDGLRRNRINLYFIYIQSSKNSPDLETVGPDAEELVEEIALHVFFQQLDTSYRVFQANDPESMKEAVQEIDQQQNLPLTYLEPIPRVDFSRWFYFIALAGCLVVAVLSAFRINTL